MTPLILALLVTVAMTAVAVVCLRRNFSGHRVFPEQFYVLGLRWSPLWLETISSVLFLTGALLFDLMFLLLILREL